MASSSGRDHNVKRTRLQEEAEKRIEEEQLKEKEELKRKKKMFKPRKVMGPRDILVNSNVPKIKLEEDVENSSTVKLEPLETGLTVNEPNESLVNSPLLMVKPEFGDSSNVTVGGTLSLESSELTELVEEQNDFDNDTDVKHYVHVSVQHQDDGLPQLVPEDEHGHLSRDMIDSVEQDEPEVSLLKELIERLELRLCNLDIKPSTSKLGNDESTLNTVVPNLPGSISSPNVNENSTGKQQEKGLRINWLSHKVLELQQKIYENLPEQHLKKVLPILYAEFKLKDTYDDRSTCSNWQTAAKLFVNDMGHIPSWDITPLQILAKTYKYTDLSQMDNYIKKSSHNMSKSTVWLDNISLEKYNSLQILKKFLSKFGDKIKYFKIRQCIDLKIHFMDSKIEQLMDFLKFCLERLPNLEGFSFIISTGTDKSKGSNYWKHALRKKTEENEYWHGQYSFPKLENLESLIIDFSNFSTFIFLKDFASSIMNSYSNQLKNLSILSSESRLWNIESLVAPNLTQLTIRQSLLGQIEFSCRSVKHCTILDHTDVLKHDDLILIEAVFPKVECLRFNFDYWRAGFHESLWTFFTPKLPNVLTLELENCRSVTFTVLSSFPNLRYLKLISMSVNTLADRHDDDRVLNIRELFQQHYLYRKRLFWENFQNISLVTLELSESDSLEPEKCLAPKLYTYTRKGYEQYWSNIFQKWK